VQYIEPKDLLKSQGCFKLWYEVISNPVKLRLTLGITPETQTDLFNWARIFPYYDLADNRPVSTNILLGRDRVPFEYAPPHFNVPQEWHEPSVANYIASRFKEVPKLEIWSPLTGPRQLTFLSTLLRQFGKHEEFPEQKLKSLKLYIGYELNPK